MINREVVKDAVFNSMKEKVFHSVVNSAFVNAIPIDKSELDLSTRRGLAKYSFDALEAAGGFSLLEKAIENETDTFKHDYLVAVRDVCTESAMEVASRVAKEYYEANKPGMILSAGNESSKFVDTTKAVANKTYNSTKEIADRTAKLAKHATKDFKNIASAGIRAVVKNPDKFNTKPIKFSDLDKEACEAIRSEVINGINNMNFRDLVSTANEVTNDSIQNMIANMSAVEHTEAAVRDYVNTLRLAIATEAGNMFESVLKTEDNMNEFLKAMEAEEEDTKTMVDENDPEYAEMMEAKKAHQEGTDQADDILAEDDPDAVMNDETKPDEFDEELNKDEEDKSSSIQPEVIRHGVPLKKLVADAKMTDEEYNRFASRLDRLDIPAVTNIVNDRVVTAMKAEKETYQLNDEANQRLKDAITSSKNEEINAGMDTSAEDNLDDTSFETPDDNESQDSLTTTDAESNEIKESVLAIPMMKHTQEHVSVFSKIQSSAIEGLLAQGVKDFSTINFDILRDITLESTLDIFPNKPEKTFAQKMERLNAATEGFCIDSINKEDLMTVGTAMCTIIFTLLQTLHTMNLVKVTPTMARTMCTNNHCGSSVMDPKTVNNVTPEARAALEEQRRAIAKIDNVPDLENVITAATNISNNLAAAKAKGAVIDESIESTVNNIIDEANKKISSLTNALESVTLGDETLNNRYLSMDISSMDMAANAFRNTPVDQLNFKCTESADGTFINIVGIKDRKAVKETSAVLKYAGEMATENYIGLVVSHSKMNNVGSMNEKASRVVVNNGKRTKI